LNDAVDTMATQVDATQEFQLIDWDDVQNNKGDNDNE
jgi:hypothetical protein